MNAAPMELNGRFEADSPLPHLIKTVPHLAFEVANLQQALKGKQVLIRPNSPSKGVTVAFIVDQGIPIEFLQIDIPKISDCNNFKN